MKQLVFVGNDEPLTKRQRDVLALTKTLLQDNRESIVAVGFSSEECSVSTIDCNRFDLLTAAGHILTRAFDETVIANLGRYRDMELDEDGCGIDPDFSEFDSEENT